MDTPWTILEKDQWSLSSIHIQKTIQVCIYYNFIVRVKDVGITILRPLFRCPDEVIPGDAQ